MQEAWDLRVDCKVSTESARYKKLNEQRNFAKNV